MGNKALKSPRVYPERPKCDPHPDIHMRTCSNCYAPSRLQRLKNATKWSRSAENCQHTPSCSPSGVRLVFFRDSSSNGAGSSSSQSSSDNSLLSSPTSSAASTNSSTGSTISKRWNRGRSEKRWATSAGSQNLSNDSKSVWPITTKESLFFPEFPIKRPSFGDYEVVDIVSHGKFSDVWKIRQQGNRQPFALKRLAKNFVISSGTVLQAKDEARLQKSLPRHPFIVSAVTSWQTRSHLYLVTEFVNGGDLSMLWHKFGAFSEPVVQLWAAEIALALEHLHSNGILYRDLKLNNTLIDGYGHVKLADFGFAKNLGAETRARTICGTLSYMAPEVLAGEFYDHAADWWSYGVVLYALFLGQYPVEAEEDHFLMRAKVASHRYFGSTGPQNLLSPAAARFLEKLLQKDPAKRLRSFADIRREPFFSGLNFAKVFRKQVPALVMSDNLQHRGLSSTRDCSFESYNGQLYEEVGTPEKPSRATLFAEKTFCSFWKVDEFSWME